MKYSGSLLGNISSPFLLQWGDASRLLSFYQEWLDDLFPKAKFLDALAMVEKAGHNKMMQKMRVDWINEGRPKSSVVADGGDDDEPAGEQQEPEEPPALRHADRIAPIFEKTANGARPSTPPQEDLFGDDIYGATPIGAGKNSRAAETGGEPDQDELDALMAEMEQEPSAPARPAPGATKSIFGDGKSKPAERPRPAEPDDDDLDALMAEAEADQGHKRPAGADAPSSRAAPADFNDDEEAMAEMDGLW